MENQYVDTQKWNHLAVHLSCGYHASLSEDLYLDIFVLHNYSYDLVFIVFGSFHWPETSWLSQLSSVYYCVRMQLWLKKTDTLIYTEWGEKKKRRKLEEGMKTTTRLQVLDIAIAVGVSDWHLHTLIHMDHAHYNSFMITLYGNTCL